MSIKEMRVQKLKNDLGRVFEELEADLKVDALKRAIVSYEAKTITAAEFNDLVLRYATAAYL